MCKVEGPNEILATWSFLFFILIFSDKFIILKVFEKTITTLVSIIDFNECVISTYINTKMCVCVCVFVFAFFSATWNPSWISLGTKLLFGAALTQKYF